MTPARITLTLYQHAVSPTAKALLLSRTGRVRDAAWIPVSLIGKGDALQLTSPHGDPCREGKFEVEEWKARQLGWIESADERQGELI